MALRKGSNKKTSTKAVADKKKPRERAVSSAPKKTTTKAKLTKARKTTAKKTVYKKTIKKATAKTSAKKIPRSKKSANSVNLPTNMSLRSVEKSIVLGREFDYFFREAMYKIAYVSAICFIVVGTVVAFSNQFSPQSYGLEAQLVSAELQDPVTEISDPQFTLLTDLPESIQAPLEVTFVVTDAKQVEVKLISSDTNEIRGLEVSIVLDDKYKTVIPADKLPSGWYKLQIIVTPANETSLKKYNLDEFFVGVSDPVESDEDTVTDSNDSTSDSNDLNQIISITDESSNEDPILIENTFKISSPDGISLSRIARINVSVPEDFSYVELYARPVNSLQSRFITLASKRFSTWQFSFDTVNIPNGEYNFYAQTKSSAGIQATKPLKLTVNNQVAVVPVPIEELQNEDPDDVEIREFLTIKPAQIDPSASDETDELDIAYETDKLVAENFESLDDLLRRYAIAKQSGDEILIQAARDALESKRDELITQTLSDERVREISENLNTNLAETIADLQNRVDTFEEIRRTRSSGKSSVDSDHDGISDFDEEKLYGTNPAVADSDNDGISDGIEIIRGYNPVDATPEAVIKFESPKDSIGLSRPDVLVVETVTPIEKVVTDSHEPPVISEIRGRGLPDSFVTLYIFSTPTVVTIRTNTDGDFVYTFDKELEDGQHDVYVAVTDNRGEIIAHSNPFSFVKEARAYTRVEGAQTETVTIETAPISAPNEYNMVIGMAILALGIILLMLGVSLRLKDTSGESDVLVKEETLQDTSDLLPAKKSSPDSKSYKTDVS